MIALVVGVALAQEPVTVAWIDDLVRAWSLTAEQEAAVRAIAAAHPQIGPGLPGPTHYAMTQEECRSRRAEQPEPPSEYAAVCGRPHMAPLYDPATQTAADAPVCIDQYEFPGVPCAYPIVWARASEATELCAAVGKRLCDAHEWEGACAGALHPPDYRFDLAAGQSAAAGQAAMRAAHNRAQEPTKRWATGITRPDEGVCAQGSAKSPGCDGSDPEACGTNTYPAGAFVGCVSPLGVYDQHGNVAEHMNLPLGPDQLASAGGLGVTEMKGSWFIFDGYYAHEDWCRWRAPYWHGGLVAAPDSHRNYHLGFRCCARPGWTAGSDGGERAGRARVERGE